jgi:hypothetical protein
MKIAQQIALLRVAQRAHKVLERKGAELNNPPEPRGKIPDFQRLAQQLRGQHQLSVEHKKRR